MYTVPPHSSRHAIFKKMAFVTCGPQMSRNARIKRVYVAY